MLRSMLECDSYSQNPPVSHSGGLLTPVESPPCRTQAPWAMVIKPASSSRTESVHLSGYASLGNKGHQQQGSAAARNSNNRGGF